MRKLANRAAAVARGLGWSGRISSARAVIARGFSPLAAGSVLVVSHFSTTRAHAAAAKPVAKEALVTCPSGLKYVEHVVGSGDKPEVGWIVQVHYVGTLLATGAQFDSSRARGVPLEFPVGTGRVIPGWDEGILSMRVGGKRRLIIPPELGYGARGMGAAIPPNASLVFEVELVGCKPPPASIFESVADMIGMKR